MQANRQLALPFGHQARFDPADFLADRSNAAALAWLDAPWPGLRLAVWGAAGCGKTHLLHVWAQGSDAALLQGHRLTGLVRLPPSGGIAVDGADAAAEEPLLHLLNAASEANLPVLLAARTPPAHWATALPDLSSRLRAITAVEIERPDEAMLRTLFASQLSARQLAVPEGLQDWLLVRLSRDPAAIRAAAARLDGLALAAGRRVTQAMAAQIVGDDPGETAAE